ncbi:MAG: hypothetical protein AAF709_21345 [Pseudomonadota bacterium]
MAYFEFQYLGDVHAPVVADFYGNAEGDEKGLRIGQIDQPDGRKFRAHLFLPDAQISHHDTREQAAAAMLDEAALWLRRMKLSEATT